MACHQGLSAYFSCLTKSFCLVCYLPERIDLSKTLILRDVVFEIVMFLPQKASCLYTGLKNGFVESSLLFFHLGIK